MKSPVISLILVVFSLLMIDNIIQTYYIMRHENELNRQLTELLLYLHGVKQ